MVGVLEVLWEQREGGQAQPCLEGPLPWKWSVLPPLSHREDSPTGDQEGLGSITSYFGEGPRTHPHLPHRYFQKRGLKSATTL